MATRSPSPTPATCGRRRPPAARRLASPPIPARSCFPRFSPDGEWIAFTGQYDGDEQVYVVPAARRRAAPAHLVSGHRAAAAALGLRPPGLRLDAGRQGGAVPLLPLRRAAQDPPLHGVRRRRSAGAAADAALRRRRSFARRPQGGLLAAVPRLPHLEALPGRLGAGSLHLRPGLPRADPGHRSPPLRPRSDVDRRRDLLQLGSRRQAEPLPLRRRLGRDDPAHPRGDLGRALAERRRRGADRLRARRRAAGLRHRRRHLRRDLHRRAGRRSRHAPGPRSRRRTTSRTSSSAPRASGRCSWRAATSSRRRSRRDRPAT